MNKVLSPKVWVAARLVAGVGAATLPRLWAAGAPESDALYYRGLLETPDGEAVTGSKNVRLALYTAVDSVDTVCETGSSAVTIERGHFEVKLPDACVAAIHATPTLWIGVEVDGAPVSRTQLGAVPYALEASHAAQADNAGSADHATSSDSATNASHADSADSATNAINATNATNATNADYAANAGHSHYLSTDTGNSFWVEWTGYLNFAWTRPT
jgi:hypothetical protein